LVPKNVPPDPRGHPPGVYVQLAKFVTWIAEQMEYVESMKESLSCMSASNITNDADDLAAGYETMEAPASESILVPVGETSGGVGMKYSSEVLAPKALTK
jgi:hypothetical protein